VAGQLQPLVRRRGSTALAEAPKLGIRMTDRVAELTRGRANEWQGGAQEHCGPRVAALGKLMMMGTAIR